MKTPEGQQFGPISRSELDGWVAEGRVTSDSQILQEGGAQWQWAKDIYPVLAKGATAPASAPVAAGANPFADIGDQPATNPYASPRTGGQSAYTRSGLRKQPHRGGMILAFGILSWVVCVVFGIMAWSMGASDLRAMRMGRMDSTGMGMTQAGMIIGMISCILSLVMVFFMFVVAVLGGA